MRGLRKMLAGTAGQCNRDVLSLRGGDSRGALVGIVRAGTVCASWDGSGEVQTCAGCCGYGGRSRNLPGRNLNGQPSWDLLDRLRPCLDRVVWWLVGVPAWLSVVFRECFAPFCCAGCGWWTRFVTDPREGICVPRGGGGAACPSGGAGSGYVHVARALGSHRVVRRGCTNGRPWLGAWRPARARHGWSGVSFV